jgi:hypothetical protein
MRPNREGICLVVTAVAKSNFGHIQRTAAMPKHGKNKNADQVRKLHYVACSI